MKRLLTASILAAACAGGLLLLWEQRVCAVAGCKDTYYRVAPDTDPSGSCSIFCNYTYTKHWAVYFMDGYERKVNPEATGQVQPRDKCEPAFETPTFADDGRGTARWKQISHDTWLYASPEGFRSCVYEAIGQEWTVGHICQQRAETDSCTTAGFDGSCPPGTSPDDLGMCCSDAGSLDDAGLCDMGCGWSFGEGQCVCNSPVLIDVAGDGFDLTDAAGGVLFDLNRDGAKERLAWTQAGSDDAWLSLDVDGDGTIGDGGELFGNYTRQPSPPEGQQKNGFLALAVYDRPAGGGNGDGLIDGRDAVFSSLRLWRDENRDGVSQPGELHALAALGLDSIALDYRESGRRDAHGNRFRYRAKVADARGAQLGRWAWDVFLVNQP